MCGTVVMGRKPECGETKESFGKMGGVFLQQSKKFGDLLLSPVGTTHRESFALRQVHAWLLAFLPTQGATVELV